MIAATTFWFFNALNKTYSTRLDYPIEFDYNSLGLINVEPLPEHIQLNVSGGGWNLLKKTLWFDQPALTIPLEKPVETRFIIGSSLYPMISEQLNELQVNYVVTDTLYLYIEPLQAKTIAVKVDSSSISLEEGYRLTSPIRHTPDTVVFEGPVSMVRSLPDPLVINLPDESIDEDYQQEIPLDEIYRDPLLKASHDAITVTFDTELFTRFNRVADIRTVNFPEEPPMVLSDTIGILSFYVQQDNLKKFLGAEFELTANWENFNPEDSTISVEITRKPPYAVDIILDPKQVKVLEAVSEQPEPRP